MDLEYARRLLAARGELRVQAHPATDAWMSGDRYGAITAVGRTKISVKMDRSGRLRKFAPENVELID